MTTITALLCTLAAFTPRQDGSFALLELESYSIKEKRLAIQVPDGKMAAPKVSPKNKWEFEWVVSGLARKMAGDTPYALRVRVFSERSPEESRSAAVAQMVMRLWDFNYQKLRLDHSPLYNYQIVDFYLCWGGKPGGEQLFAAEGEPPRQVKVNTVYIYDIPSFNVPIEMAREVAHEYGHATLPPVGIFEQPEDWANGFLGEKLYLRWIRNAMAAKALKPADAMGVDFATLDSWVKRNVDPLVRATAIEGPQARWLASKGQKAMDTYIGLVLYADTILPAPVVARSMKLIGSTKAVDYPQGVVLAVEEAPSFAITLPPYLAGRSVWLPLGKSKVEGAKELKRAGGWVQVQPSGPKITVQTPRKEG